MKKVIVNENERGFLFKEGKFVKVLKAGKYYTYGDRLIEVVSVDEPVFSDHFSCDFFDQADSIPVFPWRAIQY